MPAFQNSLTFNSVSDITFTILPDEIKIYVQSALLGSINKNYPVTVYTVINGTTKTLWMKQVTMNDYTAGNTNDANTDTIKLNPNSGNLGFNVQCCASNPNRYKMIGWETETVGQICAGGNGSDGYYDISSPGTFKSMMEQINSSGLYHMVTRYASDVNKPYSGGNIVCSGNAYCYICLA